MVNIGFATGAEQPINRDGRLPAEVLGEGDVVGIDSNGELAKADADSAVAQQANGVSMAPVRDESSYGQEFLKHAAHTEYVTLQNDKRVAYARYGVILENADEDWDFTPGEPVYLAVGGGFTDVKPTGTGEVQQVLGYAIDDGNSVFLDIDAEYSTA